MITSNSNEKIKQLAKLLKSTKYRKEEHVFVVEGIRMFREIPEHCRKQTYITNDCYEVHQAEFEGISYEIVSDYVMKSLSDTKNPQGILSLVTYMEHDISKIRNGNRILILENIQDPGNLGTMIRTAEAGGIDGIIMSHDTVDIYNSKTVRATMGSVFRIPFCYTEDIRKEIELLKQANVEVYGADLEGSNVYACHFQEPFAFCIGNEGNGLSQALLDVLTKKVTIPMMGNVESLNAATAATVLIYEALRQRNFTI